MIKRKFDFAAQYIKNVIYYMNSASGKLEFIFTVVQI